MRLSDEGSLVREAGAGGRGIGCWRYARPLAPIRRSPKSDRAAFGINPGDIKMRQDSFGFGMAYPQVIPHNDGCTLFEARVFGPYLAVPVQLPPNSV